MQWLLSRRSLVRRALRRLRIAVRTPFYRRQAFRRLRQYHAQARSLEEVVAWAGAFGGRGSFAVKMVQIPSEIAQLARAVKELRPKTILEIGTWRGGTLLLWSSLASERVISCDIEDMRSRAPLYQAFPPPGSRCQVMLLSGDSHDPAFRRRVAEELAGRMVDFLFIDGDHTEAGVTADYYGYRKFVRPGGIIALHDIVERQPSPTNQVYHLWKRIKQEAITQEFVDDSRQCGYGIGVVRVPGYMENPSQASVASGV